MASNLLCDMLAIPEIRNRVISDLSKPFLWQLVAERLAKQHPDRFGCQWRYQFERYSPDSVTQTTNFVTALADSSLRLTLADFVEACYDSTHTRGVALTLDPDARQKMRPRLLDTHLDSFFARDMALLNSVKLDLAAPRIRALTIGN